MTPFSSSSPTNELMPPGVLPPRVSRLPFGGAAALGLGALATGVLLGALYHFVARFMDLVILFPLAAGLLLGALLAVPICVAKIRARSFVICCAILASTLLLGTRLFCDSLQAREEIIQSFSAKWSRTLAGIEKHPKAKITNALSPEKAEALLRRSMPPLSFFKDYLQDAVQSGLVIGDVGKPASASDLAVRGPWFWALEFLNLALVASMAMGAMLNYASAPFCENCRRWLGQAREVTKVHPDQSLELVEKLKRADWESAAGIVGQNVDDKHQSVVSLASCPSCEQTQLKVKTTRGTMPKTVLEMPISAAAAMRLRDARARRL